VDRSSKPSNADTQLLYTLLLKSLIAVLLALSCATIVSCRESSCRYSRLDGKRITLVQVVIVMDPRVMLLRYRFSRYNEST
jgi:hypothetical protein